LNNARRRPVEININAEYLPRSSSGDPVADICAITGKSARCTDREVTDEFIRVTIPGGTNDDFRQLEDQGYLITFPA
jgi:hypothetical protein